MCGITGYIGNKQNGPEIVFDGLKKLEYRGYDSWGIAAASPDGIKVQKKTGEIGDSKLTLPPSSTVIGHTRWATHGGVTVENAHPHLDCTGTIAVIHNGIVENYQELKKGLVDRGHTFKSETDTEVIPHLIEEQLKKKDIVAAVRGAFNQLQGMSAIVVVSSEHDMIVACKNGSPLVVGFGEGENYLASDVTAFIDYTRRVVFLDDGEMVVLTREANEFYSLLTSDKVTREPQTLDWNFEIADKGSYPHFLLKEIHEQPKIIANIAENYEQQVQNLAKLVKEAFGTYLIGAGTAGNACLLGEYYLAKIAKTHINFAPASEFRYLEDFLKKKSLVIALTQSGETIDVIEPLQVAQGRGCTIGTLVNVIGSTIYRMGDFRILLNAGPEKAVLSTKAFTAKASVLLLLAYQLKDNYDQGKAELKKAVAATNLLLTDEVSGRVKALAEKIVDMNHIFILGRGTNFAVALEAALKIKEGSYTHAEAFAGGELKHGVIALIEKGTPIIVFAPNDETYDAIISNAMEVKARGGYIIGVTYKKNEVFDETLMIQDSGEASAIPMSVYAQLLAYHLATLKGINPDRPRNLAKSVTVK